MSTIGATKGTQVSFSIISTKTTLEPLGHGQTHRNPPLSGKFILSFLSLLSTALLGLDHATKVALGNRNLLFIVRSELWSSPSSWLCRNSLPRYALLWAYGAAIKNQRWTTTPLSAQRWKEPRLTGDRAMRYERKLGVNKVRFSAV